ncbi:MAG: hypothetical protein HOJ16_06470 [Candidatus Peribacter sp.]|jgi:hypothetical protein|nr:hypothetical protein [Candidatus Peribacter sp.]
MPDVKPEKWDSSLDRDVQPDDSIVLCTMYDSPVMTIDDPLLNPPEEE